MKKKIYLHIYNNPIIFGFAHNEVRVEHVNFSTVFCMVSIGRGKDVVVFPKIPTRRKRVRG